RLDDDDDGIGSGDEDYDDDDDGGGVDADYDVEGDDTAAQVLFGNRSSRRGRGRSRGRGRGRGAADGDDYYDPEEEEEGEDLLENAMKDYQPIAALDTYGREGIDDRDYGDIDVDDRFAAERVLEARDRERRKLRRKERGGRAGGFYGALEEMAEEEMEEEEERRRRRGMFGLGLDGGDSDREDDDEFGMDGDGKGIDDDNFEAEDGVNLEAFDVPLREWIAQDRTRREIQRKFRVFLSTFREGEFDMDEDLDDDTDPAEVKRRKRIWAAKSPTYEDKIRVMCAANKSALEVNYVHLSAKEPILALWINEAPKDMFDVLNEAATRHTFRLFPSYHAIRDEIHVRVSDVPLTDSLRDMRHTHLDNLVKVSGVITRRSGIFPQLKLAFYDCVKCKFTTGPFRIEDSASNSSGIDGANRDVSDVHAPASCPECQSEGPFRINSNRSSYRNYQRINLQERPGSIPPGRVPRTKEVVFLDDLVDSARPGEEVEITGVFCHSYDSLLTQRSGFPVFQTFISANHVRKKEDASSASNLSESDRKQILELARDPNIGKRIVQSIAPSIYGHENVKMALAMALFGAVPKNVDDKHRIRGDVNVLILGDPGTAKSQMLKYAEATAPRAVYSTGKGASAVGLTANVHKDPLTREWTLEGGKQIFPSVLCC
ncbi:hypothetical protein ACHAXS_011369, partial [Conticribra weissflogii]